MKATIETTNGITLVGTTTFIGGATIALHVATINAATANELYKVDASMTQNDDYWHVQIAKRHIKTITFAD